MAWTFCCDQYFVDVEPQVHRLLFKCSLLQVPDSIGLTVACLGHPVRPYFMVDTLNLYFAHENAQHFRMMHLPLLWKRHNGVVPLSGLFAQPLGASCATLSWVSCATSRDAAL